MKRLFLIILSGLLMVKLAVLSTGCANIIPPEGGPRDSLPPRLLKADPADSTRRFDGARITFTFDEFVEVTNIQENLLVSPLPRTNPVVDYKLKTVTLKLKDSLEANTTYRFDFGSAIKDFAEGNVLKHFTYTFSTGPYIDSLQLTGRVLLAETGKADSTLIVMLHTSPGDSAVVNEKPRYIAKPDGEGRFLFTNLPAKTFYIYALKDDGGTKRYMTAKQLFAFADKPVNVSGKTDTVTLYAWGQPTEQPATAATLPTRGRTAGNADRRLRYQNSLSDGQQDLLSDFVMQFEQPLRQFDSTRIRLYMDSAYTPATGYGFIKDSSSKKLTMKTAWAENRLYHLVMEKEFAEDSLGRRLLKTDTLSFRTRKKSDYGSLKLRIRNLEMNRNPVLFFLQNGTIVRSFPMSGPDLAVSLFLPGEYELRVLYDENKNGKWDPGQFFGKHKQPEIARPIERRLTIKPGWQNEFELAL